MTTPSNETLDAICVLITNDEEARFEHIDVPEQRLEVVRLALQAEANDIGDRMNEWLEAIDGDLDELRQWFKVSRPYDGV